LEQRTKGKSDSTMNQRDRKKLTESVDMAYKAINAD
jgi:hypothetical protein